MTVAATVTNLVRRKSILAANTTALMMRNIMAQRSWVTQWLTFMRPTIADDQPKDWISTCCFPKGYLSPYIWCAYWVTSFNDRTIYADVELHKYHRQLRQALYTICYVHICMPKTCKTKQQIERCGWSTALYFDSIILFLCRFISVAQHKGIKSNLETMIKKIIPVKSWSQPTHHLGGVCKPTWQH